MDNIRKDYINDSFIVSWSTVVQRAMILVHRDGPSWTQSQSHDVSHYSVYTIQNIDQFMNLCH
jgi:hypothetical protein